MGRRKGSKNREKGTVPTSSGSVGIDHNASKSREEMTDEQRYVLIQQGVGKYKAALADKQEAESEARSLAGTFKSVCKAIVATGVSIDEIKSVILQETDEGRKTITANIEMHMRIARYRGAPLGHQFDMFGGGEDRTPSVDKAKAAGYALGLQGGDRNSHNWHPGTPQYEAHYDGYAEAQKVLMAGIRQKDGEVFDQAETSAAADPTIAETIKAADPFEGANLDPEAHANQTANVTPISNGRKRTRSATNKAAERPAPADTEREPVAAVAEEF